MVEFIPLMLGGMEKYGRSLCDALQDGADVTLVTAGSMAPAESEPSDDLQRVRVHLLPRRELPRPVSKGPVGLTYTLYLRPYLGLVRLLRREQSDAVHIHFGLHLLDWLVPVLAPKRCLSVLTAHDPVPHRWLLPRPLQALEKRIMRWRYHRFDRVIVHSEEGAEVLERVFGISRTRIRVIPHGSDVRSLATYLDVPRERGFTLLGQLRRNKSVVEAIEAYQSLGTGLRARWPLIVAGRPESPAYGDEIASRVALDPAGIDLRTEHLSAAEFDRLLGGYAYTLLPYQNFSSMSGVLMRAMAMGTVPVANLETGLKAQAPTELRSVSIGADGIAETLGRAISVFESLTEYRDLQSALVAFSREYSWEKVAVSHLALFSGE